MVASLFDSIDPQEASWTLAEALHKAEFRRDVEAANNLAPAGFKIVTRQSLIDLLERPQAEPEFEQNDPNKRDEGSRTFGYAGAAELAATMMRNAPQSSNTGGMNSQTDEKETKADDALLAPREYLLKPPPKNFVEAPKQHWTDTDPELFAKLPQGGGGVDWITTSNYGHLDERGKLLVESLKHCKRFMGKRDGVKEACAAAGLELLTHKYRDHMVFTHPFLEGKQIHLGFANSGNGRSYQPLIVRCEGICVTFGRIDNSEGPSGTRGPIATCQISGLTFLKLGEVGAFKLAEQVLASFGIMTSSMRASRMDVCADLPGQTVHSLVRHYLNNDKITKAKGIADFKVDQKGRVQTFTIGSSAVVLRIYDKVQECLAKDKTGERMDLMIQNRWGSPQKTAVRVEFQFNMGKNRSKKYNNFRELFEGMSDLIGWATNDWFRLCTVGEDRHNSARYKGPESMCDEWLRTLHAFAFWAGRLDKRHEPPRVQSRPAQHLMNTAFGFMAAAMGRAGLVPVDDVTAFGILAAWKGPDAMTQACRDRALQCAATHGVRISSCSLRSSEDEQQFRAQRRILDAQHERQRGAGVGDVPF